MPTLICDCNKTQPLDPKALGKALDEDLTLHSALCRREAIDEQQAKLGGATGFRQARESFQRLMDERLDRFRPDAHDRARRRQPDDVRGGRIDGTADDTAANHEAAEDCQKAIRSAWHNVELPIKTDASVSDDELNSHHLILIGQDLGRPHGNRAPWRAPRKRCPPHRWRRSPSRFHRPWAQ